MTPKQLASLTAKWKRKLVKSGFNDIEDGKGRLKRYDSFYFKAEYSPVSFAAQQTYYRLAGHLLHTHTFASKKQRRVWELHCNGLTQEVIAKKMKMKQQRVSEMLADVAAHLKQGDE